MDHKLSSYEQELIFIEPKYRFYSDNGIYFTDFFINQDKIKKMIRDIYNKDQNNIIDNEFMMSFIPHIFTHRDKLISTETIVNIVINLEKYNCDELSYYIERMDNCLDIYRQLYSINIYLDIDRSIILRQILKQDKLDLLDWWMTINRDKYNDTELINYFINNDTHILKWLLTSSYHVVCDEHFYKKNISNLVESNDENLLEIWMNHGLLMPISLYEIDTIVKSNAIESFKFLIKKGIPFNYNRRHFDYLSRYSRIDFLNLWCKSGLEIIYSEKSFEIMHLRYKHLEWWINSGLELKYDEFILDNSIVNDCDEYIKCINYLIDNKIILKYTRKAVIKLISTPCFPIFKWWINSGLDIKCNPRYLNIFVLLSNDINILNFWNNYYPEFTNTITIQDTLKCLPHNVSLEYILENNLDMRMSLIEKIDSNFNIRTCGDKRICDVLYKYIPEYVHKYSSADGIFNKTYLTWLKKNMDPFIYTHVAVDRASATTSMIVLEWWFNSGLPLTYTEKSLDFTICISYDNMDTIPIEKVDHNSITFGRYLTRHYSRIRFLDASDIIINNFFKDEKHSSDIINILCLWLTSNLEPEYDITFIRKFIITYNLTEQINNRIHIN
jgi:hypothetical protein